MPTHSRRKGLCLFTQTPTSTFVLNTGIENNPPHHVLPTSRSRTWHSPLWPGEEVQPLIRRTKPMHHRPTRVVIQHVEEGAQALERPAVARDADAAAPDVAQRPRVAVQRPPPVQGIRRDRTLVHDVWKYG
jgi:hypothetical protein